MNEIGKRIRALRKERNMTRRELADKLHCSLTMIAKYETGKSVPRSDTVARIGELFGVSADWLMGAGKEAGGK